MDTVICIHLYKLCLDTDPVIGDSGKDLYAITDSVESAKVFIRQNFRESVFVDEQIYNQGAWIALGVQYRSGDEYKFITFTLIERAIMTTEWITAN